MTRHTIQQTKPLRMRKIVTTLVSAYCLLCMGSHAYATEPISYWIAQSIDKVKHPVVSLDGVWDFDYARNGKWKPVNVPGELAMQGYAIEHDKPYLYRKTFNIPSDYKGKSIILRFDGVYCHARLWINGKEVRQHWGGFSRWETDVTQYVKAGKRNEIKLEVTDRLDDISYASGYAHHPIGGILRDVSLFTLPKDHIFDIKVETKLDSTYSNATLCVSNRYVGNTGSQMKLRLIDPKGREVPLTKNELALKQGDNELRLAISNPQKWDAEHPNLYDLQLICTHKDGTKSTYNKKVGFRKVEIVGNRMFVNGQQVKLRGACRHDIHPQLGRSTTAETDSLDAVLFKEANMNFVRTSHYPPTERFLEFCDRYGIYVESETAVCFVNTYRQKNYAPGASQDDTTFTHRYLGQCQEMVKSLRNHPSILFWSIGNESSYGTNFQICHDWVKSEDKTRPVIFSYPGSAGNNRIYEILSMHYQDVYGNLSQWGKQTNGFQTPDGIPALFDEWAHPPCYTYETLRNDPNIHEFWGKSLDMMWSGLFDATGGLGGAIWGYIDETFALPEPLMGKAYWKEFAHTAKPEGYRGKCVGYGDWGIVDVWRRKKPEFWATKKAYSPIKLQNITELNFAQGQPLLLTAYNRFDHTWLNEIKAFYTYKGIKREVKLEAIRPHSKGIITIPASNWAEGECVVLDFYTQDERLIDTYHLSLGQKPVALPQPGAESTLTVEDNADVLTIKGKDFIIPFDKASGLITNARAGDEVIIERGPFLNAWINLNHLSGAEVRSTATRYITQESQWKKTSLTYKAEDKRITVRLKGTYKDVEVRYDIVITNRGEISVSYVTNGLPNGYLRETGIKFHLGNSLHSLKWKRKGYWDCYPQEAMSGNEGQTPLYNTSPQAYGKRPQQDWAQDAYDYYYWSDAGSCCAHPLVRKAQAMKENIYDYTLWSGKHKLSVISHLANVACRINKTYDDRLELYIDTRWDYPEIAWGNYCKTIEALPCFGNVNMILK